MVERCGFTGCAHDAHCRPDGGERLIPIDVGAMTQQFGHVVGCSSQCVATHVFGRDGIHAGCAAQHIESDQISYVGVLRAALDLFRRLEVPV